MSADKNKLLGKKRETRSDDEKEEDTIPKKKIKETAQDKVNESDESSSSDHQPVKSLFGNANEKGFQGGLFGDLSNPSTQPKPLLGNLFGNANDNSSQSKPLAGGLFGSTEQSSSLFSSNNGGAGNIFSQNKPLFNFSDANKKEENNSDDEGGEDDNVGKSSSPNPYNPIEAKANDDSLFKKIYVKSVENFYLFNKDTKTYTSKGKGFLSIETSEEEGKKYALIMFRNGIGNSLFEGVLNDKYNKFNSYVKKFKHVAHFYFITKIKDIIEGNNAKVPFMNEEELKEFEVKYNEAILFISLHEHKIKIKKEELK